MNRRTQLQAVFVEFIPERLEEGKIYISRRYATATHLCCCGCGLEVVTPLNPAKWQLMDSNGKVSLDPSIGNWSFPCQSHYWITESRVQWTGAMSPMRIEAVKKRDQYDAESYAHSGAKVFAAMRQRLMAVCQSVLRRIRQWLT